MAFHETSNASSNRKMAESRVRSDLGAFKAASSLERTLSKSRRIICVRFILEWQNIVPGHRSKSGFQLIDIHQLNRADGGQRRNAFGQHLSDLIIHWRRGKSNVQIRSPAGITARKRPENKQLPPRWRLFPVPANAATLLPVEAGLQISCEQSNK